MACSKCGGYYSCHCDVIKMKEDLRIKLLECEVLSNRIRERKEALGLIQKRPKFPRDCGFQSECPTVKSGISDLACSDNIGRCFNRVERDKAYV